MNESQRVGVVLAALEPGACLDALAAQHGVTVGELEAWRALYLAGLRQAALARRPVWSRRPGLLAASVATLLAGGAWAQLVTFSPDTPARASEVNANFAYLRGWLERKVGPLSGAGTAPDPVRVGSTQDVGTLGTQGALVIGDPSALNLGVDGDELQARSGNAVAGLTLQRRGGNITLGSAATTVSIPGSLNRASAGVALNQAGPLPLTGSFTLEGGVVLLFVSGSAYGQVGGLGVDVEVDGVVRKTMDGFTNEVSSHKALVSRMVVLTGLGAGAHSVRLVARAGTNTDLNDRFEVSYLELPL